MTKRAWIAVLMLACGGKDTVGGDSGTTSSDADADTDADADADADTDTDTDSVTPPGSDCTTNASWTVGLQSWSADLYEGYTLFAPNTSNTTYLIDSCGREVHRWERSHPPGNSAYLLESGNLLRTESIGNNVFTGGGNGGRVVELTWDGDEVWSYDYSSDDHLQHHDVELLPSGNVLMVAWEGKTDTEAIAAGRDPSLLTQTSLWPDTIVELEPSSGTLVWEWHVWDHLIQDYDATKPNYGDPEANPGLIDLNYAKNGMADWTHINGIDYNADLDQIIVSVHEFDEVWVIDHSTTSLQAKGHTGGSSGRGGDLLYRWGNPEAWSAGTSADRELYGQHDPQWIGDGLDGAGDMMVFNNGAGRGWSTIDQWTAPWDGSEYTLASGSTYGPTSLSWTYEASPSSDFYSDYISGAQRLPNGNTLICAGAIGTFFEVTEDGTEVWRYINPVVNTGPMEQGEPLPTGRNPSNAVFRAYRYDADYAGLAGRDLTPGDYIEL